MGDVNAVCDISDVSLPVPADLATTNSGMNIEQKNVPSASSSHSAPSWRRSRCPPWRRCHWSPCCGPPPPRPRFWTVLKFLKVNNRLSVADAEDPW